MALRDQLFLSLSSTPRRDLVIEMTADIFSYTAGIVIQPDPVPDAYISYLIVSPEPLKKENPPIEHGHWPSRSLDSTGGPQ